MNKAFLKNMKLFKLVEYNHSCNKVLKLIRELSSVEVNESNMLEVLGDKPSTRMMVKDLYKALNSEHYSIWCLSYYGINMFTIEKLIDVFTDLNIMVTRINELAILPFHGSTVNKIKQLVDELGLNNNVNLENIILRKVEEKEPISNLNLKNMIFSEYYDIDSKVYDSLIDSMIIRGILVNTLSGYKIKRYSLIDYLIKSDNESDKIILDRCEGATLEEIGRKLGLTRERVRQKLGKRIIDLPIFDKEKEYVKILNEYEITKNDILILGMDKLIWSYVNLKYKKPNVEKNVIDYLKEHDLCDTCKGRKIFESYNLLIIDNEIVKDDFVELFIRYVNKKKLNSFNIYAIKEMFNDYLVKNKIKNEEYYITEDNIDVISRKLENSGKFLCIGSKNYIVYDEDLLSTDLIKLMEEYLIDFDGYGSTLLFFEQNKKICLNNKINNENELFVIMKRMFSKKFKDSIEFIRNPTLEKKGINREIYIENLLLDMDLPCTVEEYLNYIYSVTGLKKASIAANFSNIINQHKNIDGLMSLDNEYTNEEEVIFYELLNDRKCIGAKLFEFQVRSVFKERANTFLNANTIRKFGYVKTNTSVYKNCYQNRLEAVKDVLKGEDIILTVNKISKFTDAEFFTYRLYETMDEGLVLKIGKDKFLNIIARNQQDSIKKLKQDLFELLGDDEIYVLDKFVNEPGFTWLLEQNNDYNSILYSFDLKEILKFIFSTSISFNYLEQGDTFLFSKKVLSYEYIVNQIMLENETLTINEFKEILYDGYGITKSFSNTELSNMGFYCPYTSEKVYLNEKYYEYEMEEYLDGNS